MFQAKLPSRYFNKIDLLPDFFDFAAVKERYPNLVFTSAERGIGIEPLKHMLASVLDSEFQERTARVHISDYKFISLLHDKAEVLEKNYDGEYIEVRFRAPKKLLAQLDAKMRQLGVQSSTA